MGILKSVLYIAAIISILLLCKTLFLHTYPDFSVYYLSAKTFLSHGNPYYYVWNTKDTFLYQPIVLFLFIPFTLFPLSLASQVFTIISLICFFIALFFLLKITKTPIFSWQSAFLVIESCVYFPTKFTLGTGQINMLILLLTTTCVYFYSIKKEKLTGILLGLSIVIKFFPLLFLVYFLLQNKLKILFYSLTVIILIFILGWVIQPNLTQIYLFSIFPSLIKAHPTAYYNQALSGFIWREFPMFAYTNILQTIVTALLFAITFYCLLKYKDTQKGTPTILFSLMIVTSIICNSFSWQHHFVLLLPAYFFVFMFIQKMKHIQWYLYIILAISYVLTALNLNHPTTFPLLIQSHVFFGAILLYAETLYILYRYAK